MKRSDHGLPRASLRVLASLVLCASTWQFAQASPQQTVTQNTTPYRAISVHEAKWHKTHPRYTVQPKHGWIKTLPHRYRVVKVRNQTYYYSHNKYYQRSGNGYVVVKIPFAPH